jgi:hypothetical protein
VVLKLLTDEGPLGILKVSYMHGLSHSDFAWILDRFEFFCNIIMNWDSFDSVCALGSDPLFHILCPPFLEHIIYTKCLVLYSCLD